MRVVSLADVPLGLVFFPHFKGTRPLSLNFAQTAFFSVARRITRRWKPSTGVMKSSTSYEFGDIAVAVRCARCRMPSSAFATGGYSGSGTPRFGGSPYGSQFSIQTFRNFFEIFSFFCTFYNS
jgi:hypothetical protein